MAADRKQPAKGAAGKQGSQPHTSTAAARAFSSTPLRSRSLVTSALAAAASARVASSCKPWRGQAWVGQKCHCIAVNVQARRSQSFIPNPSHLLLQSSSLGLSSVARLLRHRKRAIERGQQLALLLALGRGGCQLRLQVRQLQSEAGSRQVCSSAETAWGQPGCCRQSADQGRAVPAAIKHCKPAQLT